MKINIGLTEDQLQKSATCLSGTLADLYVLTTKVRKSHWDVLGHDFIGKHEFFKELYEELDDLIDDVAERIRSLGHFPPATLKAMLEMTHLSEWSRRPPTAKELIAELLSDYEIVTINLRRSITEFNNWNDPGSADHATDLLRAFEKRSWMLRAHLQEIYP